MIASQPTELPREKLDISKPTHPNIPIIQEEYASFKIRLGAFIVDLIGFASIAFILGFILTAIEMEDLLIYISDTVLAFIVLLLYNTLSLSKWSTTFGKYLYGLRVVNADDGTNLSFGTSLKRSSLQFLSYIFFGAGYWKMNKNDKRQAWHDVRSGTVVLRKKKNLIVAYIFTIIGILGWLYIQSLANSTTIY